MAEPATNEMLTPYAALTRDVRELTTIIGSTYHQQLRDAQEQGRALDPANAAAIGMVTAWNTLAAPAIEGQRPQMPFLRARAAEYLRTRGLSIQPVSLHDAGLDQLKYLAPDILDELFTSLPKEDDNAQLRDSVRGEDGVNGAWARINRRRRIGRLVFDGLKHVFGAS